MDKSNAYCPLPYGRGHNNENMLSYWPLMINNVYQEMLKLFSQIIHKSLQFEIIN